MGDSANKHRGDVVVDLGGRRRVLRPTYEAIAAIETHFDTGLVDVCDRFRYGRLKVAELAVIVREGLVAAGENPPPTVAQVAPLVADAGVVPLTEPIHQLLLNMLTGGQEPKEGNAPAEGTGPAASPSTS